MGMINWLKQKFISKDDKVKGYFEEMEKYSNELYVRELAFACIKNQIANALSKCEIRTYKDGEESHDDLWYRLNYQPNVNQNATQFWNKFVNTLYDKNEALIV